MAQLKVRVIMAAVSITRGPLKAVLVDLSGTLHIGDSAIPGAVNALSRLRNTSLKVKFVTNTTKESMSTLHGRLLNLGFDIKSSEIFSSLTAAKNVILKHQYRPLYLLSDSAKKDFEGIPTDDPNAVVVGLAPECFNYQTLNDAFRLLLKGCPLVAIHKARYYERSDGLTLGPGAFIEGLEYAADVKSTVVGKPERAFFMEALRTIDCAPEEAVMIGDDARDDVGGAQKAGLMGILVKTGKYREGDEQKIDPKPTVVCKDFPAAVEHILMTMLSKS